MGGVIDGRKKFRFNDEEVEQMLVVVANTCHNCNRVIPHGEPEILSMTSIDGRLGFYG